MMQRLFFICLLLGSLQIKATVKTLNNNNPSPGQYSSWAQVQSTLAMGDTIYVSGSPFSYGDISMQNTTVDCTIIGTGFQPTKQQPLISEFGHIDIIGIWSNNCKVKLVGLHIHQLELAGVKEWYLTKCFIEDGAQVYGNDNSVMEYNIIKLGEDTYQNDMIGNASNDRLNIRNNVFIGDTTNGNYYSTIKNILFYNNVFINGHLSLYGGSPSSGLGANCMLYNNVFIRANVFSTNPLQDMAMYNCYDANSSTNVNNGNNLLNTNPLFVNPVLNYANVIPLNWDMHLQTGSPCIGTGAAFVDMGVYGGMYGSGFTMTGEPNIPQIKQMNLPASVIKGQSFSVDIISTNK
jgi:hypothetical protein